MCDLPKFNSDKLLVGFESSDDAAVYQLNETQAIIQTLDFFTPIVDDPYNFGAIAATNALSDVYAMGGTPTLAMNIVCFPNCLNPSILKEIMLGGADKVKEAGALLVGGHSIEDDEPKYGLSVMGIVEPDKIWKNTGAKIGDVLILTKPLGIGVLTTALKEDMLDPDTIALITNNMKTLNKAPADLLRQLNIKVSACTDVTGFGFLGHALEMTDGEKISFVIDHKKVPIINEALSFAEMGIIPAGAYKNRRHVEKNIAIHCEMDEALLDLFYDPQTSGGLLIALPESDAMDYLEKLAPNYPIGATIVGKIVERAERALIIV